MPVVSFPDLYAGKIVAALDRQHPRDLWPHPPHHMQRLVCQSAS
ncbi:nucleotidyl transferase AbiEii/AbiGii toxin family protein [Mesorhizobium silamurunense]